MKNENFGLLFETCRIGLSSVGCQSELFPKGTVVDEFEVAREGHRIVHFLDGVGTDCDVGVVNSLCFGL